MTSRRTVLPDKENQGPSVSLCLLSCLVPSSHGLGMTEGTARASGAGGQRRSLSYCFRWSPVPLPLGLLVAFGTFRRWSLARGSESLDARVEV